MMRAISVTWTRTSNGSEMCVEHDEGDIDSVNPVPELRQGGSASLVWCFPRQAQTSQVNEILRLRVINFGIPPRPSVIDCTFPPIVPI